MGWFVLPVGQIAVGHRLGSGHICKCAEAPVNPGRAEWQRKCVCISDIDRDASMMSFIRGRRRAYSAPQRPPQ